MQRGGGLFGRLGSRLIALLRRVFWGLLGTWWVDMCVERHSHQIRLVEKANVLDWDAFVDVCFDVLREIVCVCLDKTNRRRATACPVDTSLAIHAAEPSALVVPSVGLHVPWGAPGIGVEGRHAVFLGLFSHPDLAAIFVVPDERPILGWLGGVHVIEGAVGGAAEAQAEYTESGAGGGVEEEVEDIFLVGLREVDDGVGSLECLAEAEAIDCLEGFCKVDGEACFVGLGF